MDKKIKKVILIFALLVVIISTVSIYGSRYFLIKGKSVEVENPEKALVNFKIATAINPFLAEGYAYRAKINHRNLNLNQVYNKYEKQEIPSNSIKFYEKVIDQGYEEKFVYKNLGALYYRLALEEENLNSELAKKAINYLKKANQFNQEAINYYRIASLQHLVLEEIDQSLISFDKAIEINDQFKDAYIGKAYLYQDLSEHDFALLNFDKAIEIEPSATAYVGKTESLISVTQNLKTAIKTNLDALKIESDNPMALYNLVDIYTSLNEEETARFYLSKLKDSSYQSLNKDIKSLEKNINNLENEK